MERRRYLVTYDISDDKRRNDVFHTLRDHGDHAQYSVFFCELTHRELAALRGSLLEEIHQREDQVLILDLGMAENPLEGCLDCLGRGYDPCPHVFIV
ncbi:MAG: CRISPR-associated endonuclease Cas2 [Planctomycetes bacterium]|nr:CRISPR-associated endonuclease Cas2 [Planctomycetota bacterium]